MGDRKEVWDDVNKEDVLSPNFSIQELPCSVLSQNEVAKACGFDEHSFSLLHRSSNITLGLFGVNCPVFVRDDLAKIKSIDSMAIETTTFVETYENTSTFIGRYKRYTLPICGTLPVCGTVTLSNKDSTTTELYCRHGIWYQFNNTSAVVKFCKFVYDNGCLIQSEIDTPQLSFSVTYDNQRISTTLDTTVFRYHQNLFIELYFQRHNALDALRF